MIGYQDVAQIEGSLNSFVEQILDNVVVTVVQ